MKKILTIILPTVFIFYLSLFFALKDDLFFQKPKISQETEGHTLVYKRPIDVNLEKELDKSWEFLGAGFFYNPETLKINGNKRTGWFKIFRIYEGQYPITGSQNLEAAYVDMKIGALCGEDKFFTIEANFYDENKKLLKRRNHYVNKKPKYEDAEHGLVFYGSLCR